MESIGSNFDLLPNEDIYAICQNLDDKSLWHLMQQNRRINIVCKSVLKERKERYLKETETKLTNLGISGYDSARIPYLRLPGKKFGTNCYALTTDEILDVFKTIGFASSYLNELTKLDDIELCKLLRKFLILHNRWKIEDLSRYETRTTKG